MLMYIGTGGGHTRFRREVASEDFFGLEIVNGKCVLKFELGAGVATISNDKLVNDNQWHEVIAERYLNLVYLFHKSYLLCYVNIINSLIFLII